MKKILYVGDRAIVCERENPMYTLEVKNDASGNKVVEVKEYTKGLHLGMWLQPAMSGCFETECKEEFPFLSCQKAMIKSAWIEELVFIFIVAIDSQSSKEARIMASAEFETKLHLVDECVKTVIEHIVLETEPPQGMSTRDVHFTGLSAELFTKLVVKYGHRPIEHAT